MLVESVQAEAMTCVAQCCQMYVGETKNARFTSAAVWSKDCHIATDNAIYEFEYCSLAKRSETSIKFFQYAAGSLLTADLNSSMHSNPLELSVWPKAIAPCCIRAERRNNMNNQYCIYRRYTMCIESPEHEKEQKQVTEHPSHPCKA
ncbi:hypothetical protein CBL_00782 [Carabus blaptoides fortunei]